MQIPPGNGWIKVVHSDGWIYFHGEGIITDSEGIFRWDRREFTWKHQDANVEMVLQGTVESTQWTYLNHWLWLASANRTEILDVNSQGDTILQRRIRYWTLLNQFPSHKQLSPQAVAAAQEALVCFQIEGTILGPRSRAPFLYEECKALIQLVGPAVSGSASEPESPPHAQLFSEVNARNQLIASILLDATRNYQSKNHGNRLRASDSYVEPQGWIFVIISLFLFGIPFTHSSHFQQAQRESQFRGDYRSWSVYVPQLAQEWTTFNLTATVLLSASVFFLAVPDIHDASRVATLVSIILTLGSMISGAHILWQHQSGIEYNISMVRSPFHRKLLATLLSIPLAFFGWGVIAFLTAIILYSFLTVDSARDHHTGIVVATCSFVVLALGASVFGLRIFRSPITWHPKLIPLSGSKGK